MLNHNISYQKLCKKFPKRKNFFSKTSHICLKVSWIDKLINFGKGLNFSFLDELIAFEN